jgi:hypothetical protein
VQSKDIEVVYDVSEKDVLKDNSDILTPRRIHIGNDSFK